MKGQYPSPIPQVPVDKDLKSNRANMYRADPPPPTPGFEPPDEKLPDRTESPAEPVELPDLSGSIPETTEPTVFVFPVPDDDLKQAGMALENRRGNPVTQAEINEIQKGVEAANPGWTHVGGGFNRDKHGLKKEFWVPSVAKTFGGDGHKGGSFADLTFKTPSGKLVHIQTVDIDPKPERSRRLNWTLLIEYVVPGGTLTSFLFPRVFKLISILIVPTAIKLGTLAV